MTVHERWILASVGFSFTAFGLALDWSRALPRLVIKITIVHMSTKSLPSKLLKKTLFCLEKRCIMPALLDGATRISRKRKRNNVEQTKPGSPETNGHDEILLLENQILESRRHFNSITTLLNYVNEQEPQDTKDAKSVLAAIALCRVFCRLLAAGNMSRSRETSKNEALIVQWLMERYQEYKSALLSMLALETSDRSTTAMTLLMRLIKEEAVQLKLSEEAIWAKGLFTKLLRTLVNVRAIDDARAAFVDNYLLKYDDIRYHTFTQLL